MSVRRWMVEPDQVIERIVDGELVQIAIVGRDRQVESALDLVSMVDRAGGVGTFMVTGRTPTGLPGEMVTTQMVCEWKDRTDAKPQPEQQLVPPQHEPVAEPEPVVDPRVVAHEASPAVVQFAVLPPHVQDTILAAVAGAGGEEPPVAALVGSGGRADAVGDGLDGEDLPEEDVSSIPVNAR